jgi:hypothetical protein
MTMNKKTMIVGAGITAVILILLGVGLYVNPGGVKEKIRDGVQRFASPGAKPETGHVGHGSAPAAAPPAAETQSGGTQTSGTPAAEPPTVEIPTDRQPLIGMKSVAVAVRPLSRTIRTVGRVEYDERRFRTVNTKFEGWI